MTGNVHLISVFQIQVLFRNIQILLLFAIFNVAYGHNFSRQKETYY